MMSFENCNGFDSSPKKTNSLQYQIENKVLFIKERDIYNPEKEVLLNIENSCDPLPINEFNTHSTECRNKQNSAFSLEVHKESTKSTEVARRRWHILAKALNRSSEDSLSAPSSPDEFVSVRRFTSFDIITSYLLPPDVGDQSASWHCYSTEINHNQYFVDVRHPNKTLTAEDLIGFNNTGNICVWPSEEALAYCALSDLQQFENQWVLELGGGMSCLAGLMIAKYANVAGIHLTDGNKASISNVRQIVGKNDIECFVKCSVLQWQNFHGRQNNEEMKYGFILSADCLFFDDARDALVDTIWYYLADEGTALVMAPRRGITLEKFMMSSVSKGFQCCQVTCYNDRIWDRHMTLCESKEYDENIHYPILLKLTKPQKK